MEVVFTDESTGNIDSWEWDFGDGGTSTQSSPVHTYNQTGVFTVTLTVEGPGGSDEEIKTDYITVNQAAPVAGFNGDPTTGEAPLEVQFTDASSGDVDTWEWDFGDGDTSTEQNPLHTYTSAGDYTVSLTVTGDGGSSTETKIDFINVTEPAPTAEFSATPTTGEAPLEVQFTDESAGSVNSWEWDFGDGNTSTEQNPVNTYLSPGNFTVSLTATGEGGSSTETKVDYILIPVGIDESQNSIKIFPNPVGDRLQIDFGNAGQRTIVLFDTNGKQLLTRGSTASATSLDLSGFHAGWYLIKITSGNQTLKEFRIVKK